MGKIKVILWDIDGTLLNFAKTEAISFRKCFSELLSGECTDEMIRRYSAISQRMWEKLEREELTKQEVLVGRFREFFQSEGIQTEADLPERFNAEFQIAVGETVFLNDDCIGLLEQLRGRVKQYIVSNGSKNTQRNKLKNSGLGRLMDGAFISDEIGVEKPMKRFFDAVWEGIGPYAPGEVMIVGDSLTSDMQGGNNAGILCCWYNPEGLENHTSVKIDYEIRNLGDVLAIVEESGV